MDVQILVTKVKRARNDPRVWTFLEAFWWFKGYFGHIIWVKL
jgi:hypothetical protein